jgi:hypothetical protein
MNMKRTLLAIGIAAALAVAAVPTAASAQHHWGGHHWGGHFGHFGFGGPRLLLGFGAAPYAYGYGYGGYGPACYRVHRVWTRWGWRLRRGWVC